MTTPAKLFGRDLSQFDEVDVDELLSKLTAEELTMLAKEVDPDVSTDVNTAAVRRKAVTQGFIKKLLDM